MGRPLIGKRVISDFFGQGIAWPRVAKFIADGAPVVKSSDQKRAVWISDEGLLSDWWRKYIKEKSGS